MRLQRVLLLRELGLGLPQIKGLLVNAQNEKDALTTHLALLQQEQHRLARQIAAVEHTIDALEGDESLMAETMFDGFHHTQYKDEVEARWGRTAYARSDSWWRSLSKDDRSIWAAQVAQLSADWVAAAHEPSVSIDSVTAQSLAERHLTWHSGVPGIPAADGEGFDAYVRELVEMYVSDERFAANYGGAEGASFVRDAVLTHLDSADHTQTVSSSHHPA